MRDAAISADTIAPVTTAPATAPPATSGTYTSTVYVALSGTDVGSAVASTHYTTDGSTPTLASPTYARRIPITSTTTLNYRSWDHAGNAEAANTLSRQRRPAAWTTRRRRPRSRATASLHRPRLQRVKTTVSLTADDRPAGASTRRTTPPTAPPRRRRARSTTTPFTLNTPGTFTVKWFSTDLAGNPSRCSRSRSSCWRRQVIVSLTFDDGLLTQYTLADKLALKPHHMVGTFYNVSGLNDVDEQHMSWDQLTDLNNDGNEIGGHTVDHVSLKGMTDLDPGDLRGLPGPAEPDRPTASTPRASPTRPAPTTRRPRASCSSCGYTSGRAAGGLDVAGEGAGPVYTETIPPHDAYALRTALRRARGEPAERAAADA